MLFIVKIYRPKENKNIHLYIIEKFWGFKRILKMTVVTQQQVRPHRRQTLNHKYTSISWWIIPPGHTARNSAENSWTNGDVPKHHDLHPQQRGGEEHTKYTSANPGRKTSFSESVRLSLQNNSSSSLGVQQGVDSAKSKAEKKSSQKKTSPLKK